MVLCFSKRNYVMSIPFLESELSLLILLPTFKKINDFCLIVLE